MKAGLVASYDAIEFRCKYDVTAGSASVDDPATYGALFGGLADGFTEFSQHPLSGVLLGIDTHIDSSSLTSGADVFSATFDIPSLGISEVRGGASFKATQTSLIRLEDVKLYVEYTRTAAPRWLLTIGKIEWFLDAVLEFTEASVPDARSTFLNPNLTPNTIPLLATPWTVSGQAVAIGPGQVRIGPDDPVGDADSTTTISGGWRVDDGSGLEALPVSFKSLAAPGLDCDFPSPSFVSISVSNTDDMSFVSQANDDTIDPDPDVAGSQVTVTSNNGRLTLLPNLPRSIFRMNDDYAAFWERAPTPSAVAHSEHNCQDFQIPPVKNSTVENEEFIPERSEFLARVDNEAHEIEDGLNDTVFAPYRLLARGIINGTTGLATDGTNSISSEFPFTMSSPFGRRADLDHEANVISKYVGYIGHPHWSMALRMEDWTGGGLETYWLPLRQQWFDNAALPPDENTQTRNFVISEPMNEGALAFLLKNRWTGYETSWIGISRFIAAVSLSGPSLRIVLDSGSSNEWSLDIDEDTNPDDAVAVFGASITLQPLGGSSPTRTIQYDIGNFSNVPFMTAHHAHTIDVSWSLTNVTSVKVELVGKDDALVVLSELTQGDIPWPLTGTATDFAGTWIQDYLNGVGSDEAGGTSAATIADAERNFAFQYLPGKTAEWLRFTFTVVDPTLDVTLNYPEFVVVAGTGAAENRSVTIETAQVADVVKERGPGTRFGQWSFFDYVLDVYIATPIVRDPADQSSILDVLGYRNVAWRAIAPDNGLDAELATLFDSVEFSARAEFARDAVDLERDTHGFLTTTDDLSSPVYALVSSLREVPPLSMFPGRRRIANLWAPTGIYELASYSLCQGKRQYISANDPTDIKEQSSGEIWTVAESFLVGWKLHEHDHITTNVEGDFDYLGRLVKKGEGEPYHGGFAIFDSQEANQPANYEMPAGHYLRADSVAGDIEVWAVYWTGPDGGFDTQDIVTTTGNDAYPSLAHDYIAHAVWLLFERETPGPGGPTFAVWRGISDDQAVSFNPVAVVLTSARFPRIAVAPNGTIVIAGFRYDSGSSGPGTIVAKRQLPGDTALSGEFTFQSGGGDLAVNDEIIDLIKTPGVEDRWLLLAQPSGSSDLKLYESFDECATFDDLGTVLTNAKNPRLAVAPNGTLVVSGFRYDSGSSGPGTIVAKRQLPGDTDLSSEFTLQESGGDLAVADEVFDIVKAPGIEDRWILVVRPSGSSDLKEYQSFDECATFEDI